MQNSWFKITTSFLLALFTSIKLAETKTSWLRFGIVIEIMAFFIIIRVPNFV